MLKPNTSLYPTFVVYFTTIGGRCTLCRTSLLCVYILKNDFSLIDRVSFITYWSQIYNTNIRNFFHISKLFLLFFKSSCTRLFSLPLMVGYHTFGFIRCWLQHLLLKVLQIYETFFIYPNDFSFIFVEMVVIETTSRNLTNMFHSQAYPIFLN